MYASMVVNISQYLNLLKMEFVKLKMMVSKYVLEIQVANYVGLK
jgi:hypothetical protein